MSISGVTPDSSPFVLVHGAWHGGWVLDKVASVLTGRGRRATAVDLPGHGLDATPVTSVSLHDYADRLVAALDSHDDPVTLLAHSMGGVPATVAASLRPDKVARLIYVAAFVPEHGQTLMELATSDTDAEVYPHLSPSADGAVTYFDRDAARHVFYGECSSADAAWATLRLGPQPVAPYLEPVSVSAGWHEIAKTYIRTSRDRAVSPGKQDEMIAAHAIEHVVRMDTDHSPFLSSPDDFCELVFSAG